MTNPTIKIANVQTGEEVERQMTDEEFENFQITRDLALENQLIESAKEEARKSALDKLAALGLSSDEISAITGA